MIRIGGEGSSVARRVLGFFFVLTMLFLLSSLGMAEEQKPLLFLVNEELVPIAYKDNGVAKGVVVDIAQALGKKMERPIEVRAMDWLEAQALVLVGQADAVLQINQNPARERSFSFSDPLLPSEFVIFRRHDDPRIQTATDLEGMRVGVEAGGHGYELLEGTEGVEIVIIPTATQGFEFLQAGALDCLVLDRWIGEYALAHSRMEGIQVAKDPLDTSFSHIAVKKGNDQLLAEINEGLRDMKADGTLDQILAHWRGKNVIYVTKEQILWVVATAVVIALLAISSISLLFVVKLKKLNQALEEKVVARTQELALVNERLKGANEELEKLAVTDQLTQIPNRRGFDTIFSQGWRLCQRAQQPLSLIIIDVDKFKEINDEHGHLIGDEYLKQLARILHETARRPGDTAARLAGDEFAFILLNTPEVGAAQVAESLRAKIQELTITCSGVTRSSSVSLGVASLIPDPSLTTTELFSLADRALYKAKERGGNQVVRASEL